MSEVNDRYKKAAGLRLNGQTGDALVRALTGQKTPAYAMPFTGLKNEPGLPPFEQPGASLPMAGYMTATPPVAPTQPPQAPRPAPIAPPETVYKPEATFWGPALPDMPPSVQIGPPGQPQLPAHFTPNMTAAQEYEREFAADPNQFGGPGGGALGRFFRKT